MNAMDQPIPLAPAALEAAQALARQQAVNLTEALAQVAQVHPRQASAQLATHFGLETWDHQRLHDQRPLFGLWPLSLASRSQCVLVESPDGAQCTAVYADPLDQALMARLERATSRPMAHGLATAEDILAYLKLQESQHRAMEAMGMGSDRETGRRSEVETLSLTSAAEASSPAVRLVNATLFDALRAFASDIHLESTPEGMTVKYRIDGVLDTITLANGQALAEQVISRIKVMADLDIAERRVPQDGSFQIRVQERVIDLRVSIMPSVHGEDAVIRVLDKQSLIESHGQLSLEALGFDSASLATLRELANAAYGMLLVTGPTGSGKTTTLYAALAETQSGKEKIITIEDPVEYQLPGVLQIPVNEKKGLTFARGLRSILRHDPDKIMVGEIRDKETAEIAVQSALTGHLVLSTVHANSVFDVFSRFMHMGLDTYALVSALNGIWAQRLIRINCPSCSHPDQPDPQDLARFGLVASAQSTYRFTKGHGCGDCRGTGFRGRRAIAEILQLDDELRELIVQRQSMRLIKEHAQQKGSVSLQRAALELVRRGLTTLEEVRRVTLSL